jgi:hypothetical protein
VGLTFARTVSAVFVRGGQGEGLAERRQKKAFPICDQQESCGPFSPAAATSALALVKLNRGAGRPAVMEMHAVGDRRLHIVLARHAEKRSCFSSRCYRNTEATDLPGMFSK